MDNVNQPQGNGPQDHSPTRPQWFTPGGGPGEPSAYGQQPYQPGSQSAPGGPWLAGPEPPQPQPDGPGPYAYGQHPPTRQLPTQLFQPPPRKRSRMRSRKVRWTAGIVAAALLGAGGALAGLDLTGSGSSTPPANNAQAVALNSAIGYTTGCSLSSVTNNAGSAAIKADRATLRRCLHTQLRVVTGMYGEIAYHTAAGTETLAFERGVITSTTGGQLSVQAQNGTTWLWDEASSPIIRESGKQTSIAALRTGTKVFVGGLVAGSGHEARLIIVHSAHSGSGQRAGHGRKSSSTSGSLGGPSGTTT